MQVMSNKICITDIGCMSYINEMSGASYMSDVYNLRSVNEMI